MQIDAVVINASPLITLFRSGQADLLPQLFKRIVVPQAVWQEVVQDDWDDPPARELRQQSWPVLESVDISPRVAAWSLGAGESAVLSYALAHPPLRAVIDDMDARRCAQTLGISIFGTGGLLVLAKRRGLLRSVGEAITNSAVPGFGCLTSLCKSCSRKRVKTRRMPIFGKGRSEITPRSHS